MGNKPFITIIMGSKSDMPIVKECIEMLDLLGIKYETKVLSAHRTPLKLHRYVKTVKKRGIEVIIAVAGGAAHLPGVIASLTTLPVIGVPVYTSTLSGFDALLSIVQMPSGVPVGTMAIGTSGAKNAAIYASQILALKYKDIEKKLEEFKKKLAKK